MNKELESAYTQFKKTKEQFIQRIESKTKEQQLFHPEEGAWSPIEVFEHIMISESGIINFLHKNPPAESNYKVSLKNKITYKFLTMLFKSGKRVKTPVKGLDPSGNKSFDELLEQAKKTNDDFAKILESIPEDKLKYSVFKHPVSGGMNMKNTINFCTNHIIHHSHQLTRIEAHKNYPK